MSLSVKPAVVPRSASTSLNWLTTLFDVCSRVVLGSVITAFPPSLWTVAEVIRRSNLPKRPPPAMASRYRILRRLCGRTAELVVDNGREFRGHGLENAAAQAGFSVRFAPIDLDTMQLVRCAFDPGNICNPGKVFPTPRLCGEVPGPYRAHPVERLGLAERM